MEGKKSQNKKNTQNPPKQTNQKHKQKKAQTTTEKKIKTKNKNPPNNQPNQHCFSFGKYLKNTSESVYSTRLYYLRMSTIQLLYTGSK